MPFAFRCPHCDVGYQVKDELAGKHTKCKKCGQVMLLKPPAAEVTQGGSVVHRHAERERDFEAATGDEELIEAISNHIDRYVGDPAWVFHELLSDIVHLDVHVVSPTPERNWHTLVTSGMSERPMQAPPGAEQYEYAELVLCLPPTWQVSEEAFKIDEERYYWPVHWLKSLARLPHEYETWLGAGHTVPNGDPPEPFHPRTKMCCWLTLGPIWFDDEFATLNLPDGRQINFLAIVPIYAEEMQLKLEGGLEALVDKLSELDLMDLMNPSRKNVAAKKRFGIF
jgi:predicted Zn finger-like uncharacterized protein